MNDEQFKQLKSELKSHVEDTIKTTVNGKIDGLRRELTDYIQKDTEWKEVDKSWKSQVDPVVAVYKNSSWLGRIVVASLKFLALVGAAVGAVFAIVKYF